MEKKKERYYVRKAIGKDVEGRVIYKTFSSTVSKRAAENKAKDYMVSYEHDRVSSMLFAKFVEHWLETYKDGAVRGNTYRESYQKICENHLIPYFGSRPINRIYPDDIRRFFNTKEGYSDSQKSSG